MYKPVDGGIPYAKEGIGKYDMVYDVIVEFSTKPASLSLAPPASLPESLQRA